MKANTFVLGVDQQEDFTKSSQHFVADELVEMVVGSKACIPRCRLCKRPMCYDCKEVSSCCSKCSKEE